MTDLVLILGDQLTAGVSSLRGRDPARTVVLMAEVMGEATYVRHHRKKSIRCLSSKVLLLLFFSYPRHRR